MAEGGSSKYGRLFTEADMLGLLRFGINRGFDLITKPGVADLTLKQVVREYEAEHGLTFPADEPLFLLRAQDLAASTAIDTYSHECEALGVAPAHWQAIQDAAAKFEHWQAAHPARVKVPD